MSKLKNSPQVNFVRRFVIFHIILSIKHVLEIENVALALTLVKKRERKGLLIVAIFGI